MMNAAVGLLCARLEQIVKFLVVPEKSSDRKHNSNPRLQHCAAHDQQRNAEINNEPGHIDERGHERRG